jgi:hypothetical protein
MKFSCPLTRLRERKNVSGVLEEELGKNVIYPLAMGPSAWHTLRLRGRVDRVRVGVRDHSTWRGRREFLESGAAQDDCCPLPQSSIRFGFMRFLPLLPLSIYS